MRLDPRAAWVSTMRTARVAARAAGVQLDAKDGDSRRTLWLKSLLAIYDVPALTALDVPWWTFEAAAQVERFLAGRPEARVFEWGSGASSVWLGARAGSVVSTEHDGAWARSLRPLLPANVALSVVPATPAGPGSSVTSAKRGSTGLDFARYVDAIDAHDEPFDVVVIDGRAREHCLPRALRHLAPGGVVVFDNVDRARYRAALEAHGAEVDVTWTRGLTPALPYPTRTALVRRRAEPAP
ncbi:class I SAM-dependent methyltransferase [Cellulomonas wangsupingiae]|uniref:class I SAM-dependent methyltransferase n=1 Tax=Cellulomonas wangsupingiae TaxID=2968085 RepID=UPI001D0DC23E|nr:class I SAM-dependent methyltransferase [Cellulomonas wangsupingiae]MCM0640327.1 class I SAM-dependent methyltransferase [Cellulomonas wangsupingiae]